MPDRVLGNILALAVQAQLYVVLAVAFFCVLLFEDAFYLFAYQRQDILNGEYWRAITRNFTHLSLVHGLLNLLAWMLIWFYGRAVCSVFEWLVALTLCSAGVGFGLLIFLPALQTYVGLSGTLHGVLVVIAILSLRHPHYTAISWTILVFVVAKLTYETIYGATPATAELVQMNVITEAHLYGAISGVVVGSLLAALSSAHNKKPDPEK